MSRCGTSHLALILVTFLVLSMAACDSGESPVAPEFALLASSGPIGPPYTTKPTTTDCNGNCASRNSGGFFRRPAFGQTSLVYFVGTDLTPGSLVLDFPGRFHDGPGPDFAVLTSSESWGPQATTASFDLYRAGQHVAGFNADLSPDVLHEFEIPGVGVVADRIVITNRSPDPTGINDLAAMTFLDAGIAHPAAGRLVGFGSGWIESPKHALSFDPGLAGKAVFRFECSARAGTMPRGILDFSISSALIIRSTAVSAATIVEKKFLCTGMATLNGRGPYVFVIVAIDDPGGDRFRLRLTDPTRGDAVMYDSEPGRVFPAAHRLVREGGIVIPYGDKPGRTQTTS